MRNDPLCLREQARIRFLSIAAIVAAIGLTWFSLSGPSSGEALASPEPDTVQAVY
ncbi:hypothetical protein [Brevundimonas sp.]|uniref:hypothetical protein n=1 Tax=Brevundimonas sp. TaxID=1871086 RepID=UPI00289BE099|nr:hypothetical protein [Brevundimonas sp.]